VANLPQNETKLKEENPKNALQLIGEPFDVCSTRASGTLFLPCPRREENKTEKGREDKRNMKAWEKFKKYGKSGARGAKTKAT
jgi:hypothetical protein